jgi:NADH:ubiquinone reductase (non-electrogenic)
LEKASFPGVSEEEKKRLLHMVVVGGGPTGVEYAGELHDYLQEDLHKYYPEISHMVKITLIEALPHVLPMFSSQLVKYTEDVFEQNGVEIMTQTKVKSVSEKHITIEGARGVEDIPYGSLLVHASYSRNIGLGNWK